MHQASSGFNSWNSPSSSFSSLPSSSPQSSPRHSSAIPIHVPPFLSHSPRYLEEDEEQFDIEIPASDSEEQMSPKSPHGSSIYGQRISPVGSLSGSLTSLNLHDIVKSQSPPLPNQPMSPTQQELITRNGGEHPYGEHPSRTLFVRNIHSSVDDDELRSLFSVCSNLL